MSAKSSEVSREFSKFIVVGGISTVLNYGAFWMLYTWLGMNHAIASALGYIVGVLIGYQLNRHWTFSKKKTQQPRREFILYCVVYGVSLVLGLLTLSLLVDWLHLSPLIANVLVIGQTTMTNFIGLRMVVFKHTSQS